MALSKLNYNPGVSETATDEPLADTPVLNTWYNFRIGNYSHAFADVVLKQAAVALPAAAFELAPDSKYTDAEVGKSDKTIYGMWRIVDAGYAGNATTISGENFGSYLDNEIMERRLPLLIKTVVSDIGGDQVITLAVNLSDIYLVSVRCLNDTGSVFSVPVSGGSVETGIAFLSDGVGVTNLTIRWLEVFAAIDDEAINGDDLYITVIRG